MRLALALFALIACSSKAPGGAAGPSSQAMIYTTAYCQRLDRCETLQVRDNFGDVGTCTSRIAPDTDDEFRSAGTTITTDQANACAAAMTAAACDVLTSALPACQFVGSLDAGAPCGSGYQCKSGSCFRTTDNGVLALCGTCSAPVPAGADCTSANCAGGLLCAAGRCKVPAAAGEACDDGNQPCKPNLQCSGGTCAVQLAAGAACTPSEYTDGDVLLCDSIKLLGCAAPATDPKHGACSTVRHVGAGEVCGFDPATKTLLACAGASCGAAGTCVADLTEGAACGSFDTACEVPLACIGGHCGRSSIATCR